MTARRLQVVRALDRSPLAELAADDGAALEAKLAAAAQAFACRAGWLPVHERAAILHRTAQGVEAQSAAFAQRIALEGGKPLMDAEVEVTRAVDGLHHAAEELRCLAGREVPMGPTAAGRGRWAFTTCEPIGPVAAISAFNHPLNLIVHQVAPAVAAGCPVIVKPSSMTPLSCLALCAALAEAGLPTPWCQTLITDDNALAEQMACDPRVAFLSFIGSARVGWHLRSKLAPGTRCALEHGGAAPAIVDASANIPRTVAQVGKGGFYHAGQVCVSVQRLFVHEAVAERLIAQLADHIAALRVGDPTEPATQVGPLIHPREATRVADWAAEATAAGARQLGGERLSDSLLAPSLLIAPPEGAKVSRLEIFGPVVAIYPFASLDAAIAQANSLPTAFQASIFSEAWEPAMRAAEQLAAGTVLINDHTAFRTDWMPFAGRRQSGYGTGGIGYSMRDMSQEKMIVLHRGASTTPASPPRLGSGVTP